MNHRTVFVPCLVALWSVVAAVFAAGDATDPIAPWRRGVTIRPVAAPALRHTIHTYYLTCPESPDGTRVLFFASTTPDAHHGDLVVLDRATGKETIIARDIDTEDAHRAACQQWISNGKRVAYHDVKNDRWSVHVVDLATGQDRMLAEDRQLCFGRAVDDLLPLYGCHWNPGAHRDLELLDAATGTIRTVVTIADVEKRYGAWLAREFGGRPTSIFFPNISPDGQRVFFKMSAPGPQGAANNFRSAQASNRQGTVVYDLAGRQPVFMREKWGHPGWHPDSRRIIEAGNLLFDTADGGKMIRLPDLPQLSGDHPSVSPDGRLYVKDGSLANLGGAPGEWGVVVCDMRGGQFQIVHRTDSRRGAKSWRKNHPHPIFSADGRRIYFNVNDTAWTTLLVAELAR
jgi:dipeptidyl aminopeptidase/acylaminoacyl peptidase